MLAKSVYLGVLALVAATAQDIPAGVKYDLTDLTYPRLGRLTRIQGVVKLELLPDETGQKVKLISGHAMLAPQARENLAKWRTDRPVTVSYIFRLSDLEIVGVKVPKSDAFGRFFLRMFRLATYTEQQRCQESPIKPGTTGPTVGQQSPLNLEIEVTDWVPCLKTETSLFVSR